MIGVHENQGLVKNPVTFKNPENVADVLINIAHAGIVRVALHLLDPVRYGGVRPVCERGSVFQLDAECVGPGDEIGPAGHGFVFGNGNVRNVVQIIPGVGRANQCGQCLTALASSRLGKH